MILQYLALMTFVVQVQAQPCDLVAERAKIGQSMMHVGTVTPEQAADMHNHFVEGMKGIQEAEASGFPLAACDRAESLKQYFQSKFPAHGHK